MSRNEPEPAFSIYFFHILLSLLHLALPCLIRVGCSKSAYLYPVGLGLSKHVQYSVALSHAL